MVVHIFDCDWEILVSKLNSLTGKSTFNMHYDETIDEVSIYTYVTASQLFDIALLFFGTDFLITASGTDDNYVLELRRRN